MSTLTRRRLLQTGAAGLAAIVAERYAGLANARRKPRRPPQPMTVVDILPVRQAAACEVSYQPKITGPDPAVDFPRAAAGGAKWARFGVGWDHNENVDTGVLALASNEEAALAAAAANDLKVMVIAEYGPPRKAVGTLTTSADAALGADTVSVNTYGFTLDPPFCHVENTIGNWPGNQITNHRAYYGSLIHSATATSITLASPLNTDLPSGSTLRVNRLRYASINSTDPNDASVQAFVRYAEFIGSRIIAHGLEGYVELWNEPNWPDDYWHFRALFYNEKHEGGTLPGGVVGTGIGSLQPIINAIFARPTPPVPYINGATHKSGSENWMQRVTAPADVNVPKIPYHAIHPYNGHIGLGPENASWRPTSGCNLEAIDPLWATNSMKNLPKDICNYLVTHPTVTLLMMDSEGGHNDPNNTKVTLWHLRHLLCGWGLNLNPMNCFELTPDAGNLAIYGRPVYDAIKRLTVLLASLGAANPGGLEVTLSAFTPTAWDGMASRFVGANGAILAVWQRTAGTTHWADGGNPPASPAAIPATVTVPAPLFLNRIINLKDDSNHPYTPLSATTFEFNVQESPIAVVATTTPPITPPTPLPTPYIRRTTTLSDPYPPGWLRNVKKARTRRTRSTG